MGEVFGNGSIGTDPVQRGELVASARSDLSGLQLQLLTFAIGALLFYPLLAGRSQKVGDGCRCCVGTCI